VPPRTRRRPSIAIAAIALLLLCSRQALAARTDAIVLKNGDRLTGEVVQMRQGKLQVKTDDAGTLSIEWDKIASIATADIYDITLQNGSHRLGRFQPAPAGSLQVVGLAGAAAVSMADIASFARIKTRFIQRIEGSFDLGASYSKSSGVADLWFNTDAKYRRPSSMFAAAFSSNTTQQEEAEDTSRYSLTTAYTRNRGTNWLLSGMGLFESNRDLGFTFRGTAIGSAGRYLARASHVELLLAGGFAAGRESPVDAPAAANFDALVSSALSVFTYDYPTTRIDVTTLLFPSLDDPGRLRVNLDAKFKRELFKDFFVSFTAYDAFDNRPKASTAKLNDFGGSLSFGWTF
jgi:hypothetical protein